MFIRVRFLACVLISVVIPSLHLRAEDSSLVVLTRVGATVDMQLKGMTEGLTVKSKVRLRNETGRAFKGLLVKTSCGCLRPKGIDGSEIGSDIERELEFVFTPTAGSYLQTCTISGMEADDIRRDLVTFTFKGDVEMPVRLDRRSILPAELAQGSFSTGIRAVEGVEIDFAGIESIGEWLSVTADQKSKTIRLSWENKPPEPNARISVPLRWRENSYRYSIEIEIVDELISVVPSMLFFRSRGDQKVVVARVILGANGIEISPEEIVVCSADDNQPIEFAGGPDHIVNKAFSKNRVMLEWRLGSEQLDQFRDKKVVFKVGDVFTRPITCSFQ